MHETHLDELQLLFQQAPLRLLLLGCEHRVPASSKVEPGKTSPWYTQSTYNMELSYTIMVAYARTVAHARLAADEKPRMKCKAYTESLVTAAAANKQN